jgi:membrane-bound serine protease (ClpP class)
MELIWVIVVYVAGLMAMIVEMFLPGAVMGIIGFLAVCGSIFYSFLNGHTVTGAVLSAITIALVPVFFLVWRNVIARVWASKVDEKDFRVSTTIDGALLGKEGEAVSQLRPSGTAMIEGRRYVVVTRGELLQKGTQLKVTDVAGNRIVVKKA